MRCSARSMRCSARSMRSAMACRIASILAKRASGCISGLSISMVRGSSGSLADFNVEPLDLLIERRKRNAQRLGGRGLAPVRSLQLLDDLAALKIRHNFKKRRVRGQLAAFVAADAQAAGFEQMLRQHVGRYRRLRR